MAKVRIFIVLALAAVHLRPAEPPQGNSGRESFEKRCTGCHALDKTRVGPPLRKVFGRRAGADTAFPYSDALRSARFVWDARTLDRWLADPESVVSGNDMDFRVPRAEERAAIITYLNELASKEAAR